MVVDDNRLAREVLARSLRVAGYHVLSASNGEQALQLLAAEPIDLMMLDYYMNPMPGIEVLERVRRVRGPLQIPILMMSAQDDCELMVQSLSHGANDFLIRPLQIQVVLAKIRHFLSMRVEPAARVQALSRDSILPAGTRVGPYEIERPLGEGAAGRVYRARDTRLDRPVALKAIFNADLDPTHAARFMSEARALAKVRHSGVAIIYDVGETPFPHLAMELVEGPSLQEMLRDPPKPEQAVSWCIQILEALQAIHHQHILHRDLKPENLLLTQEGQIKVVDFGIAQFLHQQDAQDEKGLCGTPEFMSPEQIKNDGTPVDARSDLFSVASILYLMLTGRPPFPAQTLTQQLFLISTQEPVHPSELVPEILPELEALILKGLAKDPQERFPDAQTFAQHLRQLFPG